MQSGDTEIIKPLHWNKGCPICSLEPPKAAALQDVKAFFVLALSLDILALRKRIFMTACINADSHINLLSQHSMHTNQAYTQQYHWPKQNPEDFPRHTVFKVLLSFSPWTALESELHSHNTFLMNKYMSTNNILQPPLSLDSVLSLSSIIGGVCHRGADCSCKKSCLPYLIKMCIFISGSASVPVPATITLSVSVSVCVCLSLSLDLLFF